MNKSKKLLKEFLEELKTWTKDDFDNFYIDNCLCEEKDYNLIKKYNKWDYGKKDDKASPPKDRVILAEFRNYPGIMTAIWNEPSKKWAVALVQAGMYHRKCNDLYFSCEYFEENELVKWWEMPKCGEDD